MKRILIILYILILALTLNARQPQRGYRGFLEWNNSMCDWYASTFADPDPHHETFFFTGVSTSHGYQINRKFFVGAGIDLEYSRKWASWVAPLYLQGRLDLQFGRFTPYADLRLGWDLTESGGFYCSPTVGYRFNWGRKMGVNVGLGMSLVNYELKHYEVTVDPVYGYQTIILTDFTHTLKPYFSFRVGIDF